jgi:hypothetical protein
MIQSSECDQQQCQPPPAASIDARAHYDVEVFAGVHHTLGPSSLVCRDFGPCQRRRPPHRTQAADAPPPPGRTARPQIGRPPGGCGAGRKAAPPGPDPARNKDEGRGRGGGGEVPMWQRICTRLNEGPFCAACMNYRPCCFKHDGYSWWNRQRIQQNSLLSADHAKLF